MDDSPSTPPYQSDMVFCTEFPITVEGEAWNGGFMMFLSSTRSSSSEIDVSSQTKSKSKILLLILQLIHVMAI
jgi:hypothetical protein